MILAVITAAATIAGGGCLDTSLLSPIGCCVSGPPHHSGSSCHRVRLYFSCGTGHNHLRIVPVIAEVSGKPAFARSDAVDRDHRISAQRLRLLPFPPRCWRSRTADSSTGIRLQRHPVICIPATLLGQLGWAPSQSCGRDRSSEMIPSTGRLQKDLVEGFGIRHSLEGSNPAALHGVRDHIPFSCVARVGLGVVFPDATDLLAFRQWGQESRRYKFEIAGHHDRLARQPQVSNMLLFRASPAAAVKGSIMKRRHAGSDINRGSGMASERHSLKGTGPSFINSISSVAQQHPFGSSLWDSSCLFCMLAKPGSDVVTLMRGIALPDWIPRSDSCPFLPLNGFFFSPNLRDIALARYLL